MKADYSEIYKMIKEAQKDASDADYYRLENALKALDNGVSEKDNSNVVSKYWHFFSDIANEKRIYLDNTSKVGEITGHQHAVTDQGDICVILFMDTGDHVVAPNTSWVTSMGYAAGSSITYRKVHDRDGGIYVPGDVVRSSPNHTAIEPPKFCPACGTYLISQNFNMRCENHDNCRPQVAYRWMWICKKDILDMGRIANIKNIRQAIKKNQYTACVSDILKKPELYFEGQDLEYFNRKWSVLMQSPLNRRLDALFGVCGWDHTSNELDLVEKLNGGMSLMEYLGESQDLNMTNDFLTRIAPLFLRGEELNAENN